jgi:PAS domain S-box-containing protein
MSSSGGTYRPHIERAPIGVFEVDVDGNYVDVNPAACELVGYSREQLLDMSVADLAPDHDDPEEIPSFATARETGRHRTETTLLHGDGHEVEVLLDAVALDDDRLVAYVRDISAQKEYERLLEEQRDDLEVLNQVLRHDIRNDLQLVTAYADLLADECEDDDVGEYIETIRRSADHAVELTGTARELADVLLSAKTDQQSFDLRGVLESGVGEVESSYSDLVVTYGTAIPSVTVRANDMLGSVFRNLLKNAVQHNDKPRPEVTLSATEREETVVVRIADNGPGVPDHRKEAIFGEGEAGLDSSGTGIGLYLVESLVDSYGGDVWVEDNDPEGAVFVVELPRAD